MLLFGSGARERETCFSSIYYNAILVTACHDPKAQIDLFSCYLGFFPKRGLLRMIVKRLRREWPQLSKVSSAVRANQQRKLIGQNNAFTLRASLWGLLCTTRLCKCLAARGGSGPEEIWFLNRRFREGLLLLVAIFRVTPGRSQPSQQGSPVIGWLRRRGW